MPAAPSKSGRHVSISEPGKPLPPPMITIQRPSNSDMSDISELDDDELQAQSTKSHNPRSIEDVLAEGRRGSESLPLEQGLEEERLITSELTQEDRERIIQDVAKNMAANPTPAAQAGNLVPSLRVKKRMKVRRAVVRGPMLRLLLGRQLAGPTKQALRMRALRQSESAAESTAVAHPAVDGGSSDDGYFQDSWLIA